MIIQASTKSRGWKRGAEKLIAKELKVDCDLRDMVGSLKLDAHGPADLKLLTAMYGNVFGYVDKQQAGSIAVFDGDGKEVMRYFYKKRESTG